MTEATVHAIPFGWNINAPLILVSRIDPTDTQRAELNIRDTNGAMIATIALTHSGWSVHSHIGDVTT